MLKLTQAHKIAVSVVAIFMFSLSVMLFLLDIGDRNLGHIQASVGHSTNHSDFDDGDKNVDPVLKLLSEYVAYFPYSNDIIFSVDVEGKFLYTSESFCKLLKKDCTLLKGKLFFKYVHEEDLAELASAHAKIVKDNEDTKGAGPYRLQKANGEKGALVMFDIHVVPDKNGEVGEIVFSVKDITKKVDDMKIDVKEIEMEDPKTSEAILEFGPESSPESSPEKDEDKNPRFEDSRLMADKA
ncbi:MAG: PAS domain-containing protein [Candidatus Gracilibacteria bacterium]|nr:PAS domain-containing protein [Candidatus Gracilibacteria bacterium]